MSRSSLDHSDADRLRQRVNQLTKRLSEVEGGTERSVVRTGGGGAAGVEVIQLDASGGSVTETLPAASSGATALALRVDSNTNYTATLDTPGAEEIRFAEGKHVSSTTLDVEQSLLLSSDGSHWYVEEGQGLRAKAETVTSAGTDADSPPATQIASYDNSSGTGPFDAEITRRVEVTDRDNDKYKIAYYNGDPGGSGTEILQVTDQGTIRARQDVVAFGLSGGSGTGSSSNLEAPGAALNLNTTADPDQITFTQEIENSSGTAVLSGAETLQFKGSAVSSVSNPSGSRVEVEISGGNVYTDSDAISAINNDSDHGSTASHNYYTDSDAVSAVNNDFDHGSTADHNYYTDSDAVDAINNDFDHGSTASHNYTTASDLDGTGLTASGGQLDVNESGIQHDNLSGGTDSDAHHTQPTTGDGLTGTTTFAVDSTVARTDQDALFEDQVRIDGPQFGDDNTIGSGQTSYALALGGKPYGIDDTDGTGDDRQGDGLVQTAHGPASDYRTYLQGGHGRVAHVWNSYYDNGSNTWRSIVDNEPHSLLGLGNTTPGGTNGGGVTLATASSSSSAEDAFVWDVGLHVDVNPANVGVQTTTPSYTLDVDGDINAQSQLKENGNPAAILADDETISGTWEFDGEISVYKSGSPTSSRRMTITRSEIRGDKFTTTSIYARGNNNNEGLILGNSVPGSADKPMIKAHLNGNVGIGDPPPTSPSGALEVKGSITADGEIEAFGTVSDRRLKKGLDPLESALDKVEALTGYGFDWHDEDAVHPRKRGETDVGVVAQEVEDVLPEAVNRFQGGHSEGFKSVSYDKLVPLLVEAIKDLRSQLQEVA